MNSNKKIIMLILLVTINSIKIMSSAPRQGHLPLLSAQDRAFLPNVEDLEKKSFSTMISTSKEIMQFNLSKQAEQLKKLDIYDTNRQANELIQQNYKTPQMRFNILSLMNHSPFMKINTATGSVENFPTIHEIIEKTKEHTPENDNMPIMIQALETCLRAINGAIADAQYDAKSMFTTPDLVKKLQEMKQRITMRLKMLNPTSWLQYSIPFIIAGAATGAGLYYSGITTKDLRDYVSNMTKQQPITTNQITHAIQETATSVIK